MRGDGRRSGRCAPDLGHSRQQNSQAFEVERSANGNAFVSIGTVAAAGNSSVARSYELLSNAWVSCTALTLV